MKYLILIIPMILLISCDISEDEIQLVKGDYVLQSYAKINCDGKSSDLTWKVLNDSEERLTLTGSLDINIFHLFSQKLELTHETTSISFDIKFGGAFTHVGGDEWIAEFSDSPFSEEDCEAANVLVTGETLTWSFIEGDGCEIVMVWQKE